MDHCTVVEMVEIFLLLCTMVEKLLKLLPAANNLDFIALLQLQIQSICKNLYPTNPDAVDNNLCSGILRGDSLDPGAINVMISGSKLPPPRTVNELLGAGVSTNMAPFYVSWSSCLDYY